MEFCAALTLATDSGAYITRAGWTGTKAFVTQTAEQVYTVAAPPLTDRFEAGTEFTYPEHLTMYYSNGSYSSWTPTQEDVLTDDWEDVSPP